MMIGRKNRRLTIERPIDTPDDLGDAIVEYAAHAVVWASIEPLRGEEAFKTQQVRADVTHRIRIRWAETFRDLNPKWRARLGVTIYDLISVLDITTDHRELELLAKERQ